ncbi:synapsin-like [Oppia nitens]|uniref:synapsin-like n=1 Tax=Oppia nitens TaxID=1686743 RepID=UPI0023D9807F|nr:synapsin-like [Oppia nitens]
MSGSQSRTDANQVPPNSVSQSSDLSLNFRGSNTTSAPTSPHHSGVSSFLSRATSLTGSVTSTVQQIARTATNKDRQKILLVIDDNQTDWSKYFRGKRLQGEWDIKVEQSEFRDLTLAANSLSGTVVSIIGFDRSGSKVARSFRPDFVLIRQHIRDVREDYRDILLGLAVGNVKTLPNPNQAYNFQDRPWVFSRLIEIQRNLGKENFPLIEQTFYPNHREMSSTTRFPCVVKIGPSHSGQGKMKVENMQEFNDLASIVAITTNYCTVEPFIDAKCDIHIQKIGTNFKAFARKSISGNWKANVGSAVLEQINVNERYKKWMDEVSDAFGGLDIFAIELIVGKDGKEHIIEVTGSAMTLLGESQEDDRRAIADLVVQRMQYFCRPAIGKRASITSDEQSTELPQTQSTQQLPTNVSNVNKMVAQNQPAMNAPPMRTQPLPQRQPSQPSQPLPPQTTSQTQRTDSKEKNDMNMTSGVSLSNPFAGQSTGNATSNAISGSDNQQNVSQNQNRPTLFRRSSQTKDEETKGDEGEDTMKNLRKTFAGIFGDM